MAPWKASRRDLLRFGSAATVTAFASSVLSGCGGLSSNFSPLPLVCANLTDIEHVVIFIQENRSFDHYFGSYRGVRGFSDQSLAFRRRRAPNAANHKPVSPGYADTLGHWASWIDNSRLYRAAPPAIVVLSLDLCRFVLVVDADCTMRTAIRAELCEGIEVLGIHSSGHIVRVPIDACQLNRSPQSDTPKASRSTPALPSKNTGSQWRSDSSVLLALGSYR